MMIGPHDTSRRALIIAEIGNNHEGDLRRACDMIAAAAEAGADAVKFQTIVPERLVSVRQAERIVQLRRFALGRDDFEGLAEHARIHGVQFLSTPFDCDSVAWLEALVPAFKIASSDNTFWPLLERVADTGKPILLSTGLCDLNGIQHTRRFIENAWRQAGRSGELVILHCVTSYPTPPAQAQLRAIPFLHGQLGLPVGYSDHTLGIDACVLAVGLGACVVEKHFTLDKQLSDFRDHALSADPDELRALVRRVRAAESLLGTPAKQIQPGERDALVACRRSIVAARDLPAGHTLTRADLDWVRPGTGLAPGQEPLLVGQRLGRSLERGACIRPADLTQPSPCETPSSTSPIG